MVTNLPAEAKAKWLKVMDAKTPEEKFQALQEFLKEVPKHKGTENLVYWAKRRMAELREEMEVRKSKKSGGFSLFVEKEGAGQAILIGDLLLRSLIMKKLTNVKQEFNELPVPGMVKYEDVQIQLVNPPKSLPLTKTIGLIRNADEVIIVVNNKEELSFMRNILEENNILLRKPKGKVIIERTRYGISGIRIVNLGKLVDVDEKAVRDYIESFGIKSAIVKIIGEVALDDIEKSMFEAVSYKPTVVISKERFDTGELPILSIDHIDKLPKLLFEMLEVIRIYTKEPGEESTKDPLILKKGSTVLDVARKLHSSLAENFRYARVWGRSVKFQGQKVGSSHVLEDKDIVEIHAK
ncbi:TGS domain protein [Sulfolobus islandicus Y.N.15.51]|jgi:ribosome-interacting GTPase 1|uniref:TGS domain protein n=1 Tax=Saccharolobus islandicus (strain Y.N.15.51 / Yellowstone \|nr:TGS domain-containing protein [Sulfolobus islandicus]ACP49689.1 TGS domain protein [Sulfolobus islandicus Y.N.15.51]